MTDPKVAIRAADAIAIIVHRGSADAGKNECDYVPEELGWGRHLGAGLATAASVAGLMAVAPVLTPMATAWRPVLGSWRCLERSERLARTINRTSKRSAALAPTDTSASLGRFENSGR